jgi:hypothetical protein
VDFDTTLGFKKNKLHYIHLSQGLGRWSYLDFKGFFNDRELQLSFREILGQKGHEKGKAFQFRSIKEGFEGRFSTMPKRDLLSITFWKAGRPQP